MRPKQFRAEVHPTQPFVNGICQDPRLATVPVYVAPVAVAFHPAGSGPDGWKPGGQMT
jgi:hypothetical protein